MKAVLKEHWRYIVFRTEAEKECKKDELDKQIQAALLKLIGELGMARTNPSLFFLKWPFGILRVSRDGADEVRTALAMVAKADEKPIHIITIYTSGTLAGAKKKIKS